MKEVTIKIVHAFSEAGVGGNPAGVVLNAEALSNKEKQLIATKAALSEIAFVSQSSKADFKLEFFTPARQIAHCGHATIATFTFLKRQGLIKGDRSSKETIDGNRNIYFENGHTFMEQTAPSYKNVDIELNEILNSLNLSKEDLSKPHPPSIVATGNSFLIVPLSGKEIIRKVRPNQAIVKEFSEKHDLIGYYLFHESTEQDGKNVIASTRMFAPRYGIEEEAATGMAAGPLACYLFENRSTLLTEFTISQGEYMQTPSPSRIHIKLIVENGRIIKLFAGGDAMVHGEIIVKF